MTPGKYIKDNMLRVMRCAKVVKDHAYDITEDAELQMRTLQILVKETADYMDSLKPLQPEEGVQGILLDLDSMEPVSGKVVLTNNGDVPREEDQEE